eukprot:TRINITY_DN5015_c0_g2_i1.p2 TRINITY_DN5015_c0_g2~~TRINITY_DN5015_c0_g2_i1.p2  ORF type:complete len:316 (-),score=40.55 TRINITY_DN5015_c0_g2_i1:517-1431(-)
MYCVYKPTLKLSPTSINILYFQQTRYFKQQHILKIPVARKRTSHGIVYQQQSEQSEDNGAVKRDLVEKLFGMVFGDKSLEDKEPLGMKRMSDEALNEQYPATTTEFAEPVESDSEEMALFRPLLAKTQLEEKELRLCYDAEKDGWNAESFHSRVAAYGAAVVLARTQGGAIIGGYNPKGWIAIGEDRDSMAAFLFTWPDGDTSKPAMKLPKVGGAAMAVIDKADYGPLFGPDGLRIPLQPPNFKSCKSKLGSYYARRPDGGRTLFADGENPKSTELVDLKIFVAVGDRVKWELDGIVWKTTTNQ